MTVYCPFASNLKHIARNTSFLSDAFIIRLDTIWSFVFSLNVTMPVFCCGVQTKSSSSKSLSLVATASKRLCWSFHKADTGNLNERLSLFCLTGGTLRRHNWSGLVTWYDIHLPSTGFITRSKVLTTPHKGAQMMMPRRFTINLSTPLTWSIPLDCHT